MACVRSVKSPCWEEVVVDDTMKVKRVAFRNKDWFINTQIYNRHIKYWMAEKRRRTTTSSTFDTNTRNQPDIISVEDDQTACGGGNTAGRGLLDQDTNGFMTLYRMKALFEQHDVCRTLFLTIIIRCSDLVRQHSPRKTTNSTLLFSNPSTVNLNNRGSRWL